MNGLSHMQNETARLKEIVLPVKTAVHNPKGEARPFASHSTVFSARTEFLLAQVQLLLNEKNKKANNPKTNVTLVSASAESERAISQEEEPHYFITVVVVPKIITSHYPVFKQVESVESKGQYISLDRVSAENARDEASPFSSSLFPAFSVKSIILLAKVKALMDLRAPEANNSTNRVNLVSASAKSAGKKTGENNEPHPLFKLINSNEGKG